MPNQNPDDALPLCLNEIPIAVVDESILTKEVGKIVQRIGANAFLVEPARPTQDDPSNPFWGEHSWEHVAPEREVWVRPSYTGYRGAYTKLIGPTPKGRNFLDHVYNRHDAGANGYGYVRLQPVRPGVNSSGARTTEQSGKDATVHREQHDVVLADTVAYASVAELTKLWNLKPGKGPPTGPWEGVSALREKIQAAFSRDSGDADERE